jgi:hypothetical protein
MQDKESPKEDKNEPKNAEHVEAIKRRLVKKTKK